MNWNEVLQPIIATLIPILASALVGLLGLVGQKFNAWLSTKIENERLEGVLRRLGDAVWTVVLELQQTEVDLLKEATDPSSPGGRKITAEEAKKLSDAALAKLKTYLGPKGIETIKHVLGLDDASLDAYLKGSIESTVRTNKDAFTRSALEGGKPSGPIATLESFAEPLKEVP